MDKPSPKGSKGGSTDPYADHRNPDGTLKPGHPGGPGNPHAKKSEWLRAELMAAASREDVLAIAENLIQMAKGHHPNAKPSDEIKAAEVYLNRVLGPAAGRLELGTDEGGGLAIRIVRDGGDDGD